MKVNIHGLSCTYCVTELQKRSAIPKFEKEVMIRRALRTASNPHIISLI